MLPLHGVRLPDTSVSTDVDLATSLTDIMPTLKLKTGTASAPEGSAPTAATPASASEPKFKLKFSQPPTPATEQPGPASGNAGPKQTKAGGGGGAKKPRGGGGGGGRKRTAHDDVSPAAKRQHPGTTNRKISIKPPIAPSGSLEQQIPLSAGGLNRIMLKRRSTVPKLKQLNVKRPPPPRIPGVGYDSEDSDAEEDPAIQQAFILRMQPGEDCDYLREAIANGKVGAALSEGPAEVSMRFLDKDFRRATVTIRGRVYAAALVDLPCIVETMKSWEKKSWWKVADLNQMLLVLGRCTSDEEAKNFPLPREIDQSNMQYAHGLTPPMHWVRKRRFRKRLSYKTIANVEEEVERLLKDDDECKRNGGAVTAEYMDRAELERSQDPDQSMYDEDADADGEVVDTTENGYGDEYAEDEGDADLADNLQAMFDADADNSILSGAPDMITTDSPAQMTDRAPTFPIAATQSSTPAAASTPLADDQDASTPAQPSATEGEDDDSSGDEDDAASDDGDGDGASDADAKAEQAERKQQREEILDLEREVENQRRKVEGQKNMLLRDRAAAQLRTLEEDLRVKRSVFGFDEEGRDIRTPPTKMQSGGGRGEGGGGGGGGMGMGMGDGGDRGLFGDEEEDEGEVESEEE